MLSEGFKFTPQFHAHKYFIPGRDIHSVFVAEFFEDLASFDLISAAESEIEFVEHVMNNKTDTAK